MSSELVKPVPLKKKYSVFFKQMRFFLVYRKRIILLIILEALAAVFFLVGPFISKSYIDQAFLKKNMGAFLNITVLGASVFLFSTLASSIRDVIRKKAYSEIKVNLSRKFIKHFFSLDLIFFQAHSIGENFYRVSDVDMIASFVAEDIPTLTVDLFKLAVILTLSVFVDYRVTAAMIVLSPLYFLQSFALRKKLRFFYEELLKLRKNLSKHLQEGLSRILVIKAFGWERFQIHDYVHILIENIRLIMRIFRWTTIKSLTENILSRTIYGLIALYVGWLIIKGRLSLGTYTAAVIYLSQAGSLLSGLASRFEYFIQKSVSLEMFFEIMEAKPSIKDSTDARIVSSLNADIIFDSVTFGYSADTLVFKNLNLRIPAGKWIGIVGASGCGKTTLINLILRLYEPQSGKILIGDYDIRQVKIASLRNKVAIATQEPLLFNFSIKENIAYGLSDLKESEIYQALEQVQAAEFVKGLAQDINTNIGENASILSQGYKQRLALARAIVREPDLLLLDEATSSIDSQGEEKIFHALRQKRTAKSTIVISHRLFSVVDADRIFFLAGNSTVEEGSHQELMAKSGKYREFFHAQLQT